MTAKCLRAQGSDMLVEHLRSLTINAKKKELHSGIVTCDKNFLNVQLSSF